MSLPESPGSEGIITRFSTPAPELDDHRAPRTNPAASPVIEIHPPSSSAETFDRPGLLRVDDALRSIQGGNLVTRDFEQAIVDDDNDNDNEVQFDVLPTSGRHGSARVRRLTTRQGRSQNPERGDRSRDTSSSRSTSPANSVEAFAEPRRRQRANTTESRTPSIRDIYRRRTYSNGTAGRRPTLSNLSLPPALVQNPDNNLLDDDVTFPTYEEPGKTYKIDFEELEEFVALSAQGLIPDEAHESESQSTHSEGGIKIFHDLQQHDSRKASNSIVLNGGTLNELDEKTLGQMSSNDTSMDFAEKAGLRKMPVTYEPVDRFCLFSSEYQSATFATKLGDFTNNGTTFRDLFEVGPDGGVWWLDVQNPTKAELEVICKAFRIHRLTKEDIETQEAREKVELFQQYYFVCFRTFYGDRTSEDFLDPISMYIIVLADGEGVLSFSFSKNPHARNVRKRIGKLRDLMSLGPDYICYALIDDIVDSFAPIILEAEQESENIEDQVFIAREDDFLALLRQIGECRKRVLNIMRLLGGKADVIKGFAKRCNEHYSVTPRGDIGLYMGDIQDHVVTMMSNLGHVEKMLSRSHANYLAQLNVDNLLKGNSTNKALAKITIVATILVPLNLICGLFGMNVPVPGKNAEGLGWFFGIIGVIVSITIICLVTARRMRFI